MTDMNADAESERDPGEDKERQPEDESGEPGAEGGSGSSSSSDKLPASPSSEDDSPLGSTDQHSDA